MEYSGTKGSWVYVITKTREICRALCHSSWKTSAYPWSQVNSLVLGDFNLILVVNFQAKFNEWWLRYMYLRDALRWIPLDLTDDKSTLVQVMAWCRQATSHYLSQCLPRSLSPNGISRPQWVKCQCGYVQLAGGHHKDQGGSISYWTHTQIQHVHPTMSLTQLTVDRIDRGKTQW